MALLGSKPSPFVLSWEAGTTVPLTIYYNRLDGTVPNLSGAGNEIYVTFKNKVTDADPGVLQKTKTGGGVTITDVTNGVAIAYMTPTESVIPGDTLTYQVDVKIKEAGGNEWVAASGTLKLTQTATRTT